MFSRLREWLTSGWRERWTRAHLAFSPIGVLIATALLSGYAGVWGWNDQESLSFFADLVPLGVVVYAAIVFVMEQGVRMVFWALAQREKDIERRREEGREEGRKQMADQMVEELVTVGIPVPPWLIDHRSARNAVLLENGDVYSGQSVGVYLGRINQEGREFLAQQGEPPSLSGLWCQRGWRIRLPLSFEQLILAGRMQGLRLDASSALWLVNLP